MQSFLRLRNFSILFRRCDGSEDWTFVTARSIEDAKHTFLLFFKDYKVVKCLDSDYRISLIT